jgi:phage-related protein
MEVLFYRSPSGAEPIQRILREMPTPEKGAFVDLMLGLKSYGLEYDRATFRQLRGKLWEIKPHGEGRRYRVCYVFVAEGSMMFLHIFKKQSQKTRLGDIRLAWKRMTEVLQ